MMADDECGNQLAIKVARTAPAILAEPSPTLGESGTVQLPVGDRTFEAAYEGGIDARLARSNETGASKPSNSLDGNLIQIWFIRSIKKQVVAR